MSPQPSNAPPFGQWVFWVVVAAVVYSFIPDEQKIGYLFLVMFGGLAYVANTSPGGVSGLFSKVTGGV